MYTAPVPPVTMLSVFPVKFGVVLAPALPVAAGVADDVARGALQAAVTRSRETIDPRTRTEVLICPSRTVESTGRGLRPRPRPALGSDGARGAPRRRPYGGAPLPSPRRAAAIEQASHGRRSRRRRGMPTRRARRSR